MYEINEIVPKFRQEFEKSLTGSAVKNKIGGFFDAAESNPVDLAEEFVRNCYTKAVKHNPDDEITPEHIAVEAGKSLDAHAKEQKNMRETGKCSPISSIPYEHDVAAYPDVKLKGAESSDNLFKYEEIAETFTKACQFSLRELDRQQQAEKIAELSRRRGHSR